MGLEVIPIIAVVGMLFLSSNNPKANYVGPLKDGAGIEVAYTYPDEENDYKTLYNFITSSYTRVSTEDASNIAKSLVQAGKIHQIDPKFTAALIARESGFNKEATSYSGAQGLGQIKSFNFDALNIQDGYNIDQNVHGTTQYLKKLLDRWKTEGAKVSLALASYLRGPNAIKREGGWIDNNARAYIHDILVTYEKICLAKKDNNYTLK